MATLDKPLTRPSGSTTPDTLKPLTRPPRPFFLRSWFSLVLVVVIVAAHVIGWNVAQIDPPTLVAKWPELTRRLGELLAPDVVSQDQKQLQVSLPIVGVDTPPAQVTEGKVEMPATAIIQKGGSAENTVTEGTDLETFNVTLTTSTDQVTPGQKITVNGKGLRPNTPGKILLQSTGTNAHTETIGTLTTDASGTFTAEAVIPSSHDDVVNSFGFPNTLFVIQNWSFGNIYPSETLVGPDGVFNKIIETIFLALMATTFAIFISLPLSFLAARNLMPKTFWGTAIYTIARTVFNVLRSIEALILGVIFAATVGLGPFAGVLSLMVYAIASLGKFYSEAIEAIDPGPLEALLATGASRVQMIVYAVIPQFIPQFIGFTLYMWDRNVRASTIIGFVGGGGIGFLLIQYINLGDYHKAATAVWAIAVVVILMDWASARIRARVI